MARKLATSTVRFRRLDSLVILHDDEPAFALAARLGLRNGAESLSAFAKDWGLTATQIAKGQHNREIANLADADLESLNRVTFVADSPRSGHLGGELLQVTDWSYQSLRICPECLREDLDGKGEVAYRPHVRSWWNLASVRVCPFHCIEMLDRDPGTGKPIDHQVSDVRFAAGPDCDFARIAVTSRIEDVGAEKYILGRLGFMPRTKVELLDRLALQKALRLMDHAGAAAIGGAKGRISPAGSVPQRAALAAGYRICKEGVDGVVRVLDGMPSEAGFERDQWAPRATFGIFYNWLVHSTRHDRDFDALRSVIDKRVVRPLPPSEVGSTSEDSQAQDSLRI